MNHHQFTSALNIGLADRIGTRTNLIPDEPWRDQANCIDSDPDMFFAGTGIGWPTIWDNVKHMCEPCPVRRECTDYGRTATDGMYGGLARSEGRNVAYKPVSSCGSVSAYTKHFQRGEKPCRACRQAKRESRQKEAS